MKKLFLIILGSALLILTFNTVSWAQCPQAPDDRGECDTLNVICLDCERTEGEPGPYSVRFPLLITHDQTEASDSLAGFAIPLAYTHTNPSAYCSVSAWWNSTSMLYLYPDFNRSIYRHMFETDYVPTVDTLYANRMAQLEGDFSYRGWDMTILDLDGTSHFWLTIVPTGAPDQRWWESDRVLLATMTMRTEDTMQVCVDTTFWPPATSVTFSRSDAVTYIPRHNMPNCFSVGPPQADSVTVTAPNGGEQWCVGNVENITWTSTGISSVKIDYSVNGGTDWLPVTASYPAGGGSYAWTVPDNPSSNCLVRVCDADGDPCDQSDAVFTILDSPAAPTACSASDNLCDRVSFSWTDNSTDETGFNIYRDGSPLASVGANVTSYDDLTATAGTTYEYCVRAYNDCGESGQCCDNGTVLDVPAAPTACSASDDLCDKVSLTWTDNSDNESGFNITRDGSPLASVGANVTSYDDPTATAGTTYEYCVRAYNDCGESGQVCDDGTRLAPPAAPSGCVASDDLCDKVSFSWTDNSADESGFNIYRDGSPLGSVGANVTSYDDPTATPGTTYEYCVRAYNDCGESGQCCDDGTRQAPPAAPSGCVASDDLCDKVSLSWTDNSADETGFNIYRDGSPLASVGADVTSYDDLTATPGVTYSYCVSAYNDCGESSQACDDGVLAPQAITVTAPNGGEEWCVGTVNDITWTSDCIDLVDIDYSTDGGSSWLSVAVDVSAASGSYSWTIPHAPSTNCLVRICDAEDATPCDQSDAAFVICTGDFTLDVLEEARKVLAGYSTDYHVALTSVSGFASPCTLTVSGLPADASVSFVPNPVVPTDTSVMTISAAMTTPPGYCTLTVTGTEIGGTAIQHSEDVPLTVSWVEALVITARRGPVDVTVTNPIGDYISPDFNGILDAYYEETYDENGQPVDQITVSLPLLGRYQIEVSRGTGANANDVFDLEAGVSDEPAVVLASNVPVPLGGRVLTYDYLCLPWLIGDANGDSMIDLGDVVYLLNYLFKGGSPPEPVLTGDPNSDGVVNLGDAIYLLNYLFRSGPPPGY
jgi:hypothetical protein